MSSPNSSYAAALAAGALASATVLAACSGGAGITATPTATKPVSAAASTRATSTATTPPTPTATPYPTDVPAAARADTGAGAIAFAKFFFGRLNTAYTTGQTGLIRPMLSTKCRGCERFEGDVAKLASQAQRTATDPMLVKLVNPSNAPHRVGQTVVDVLFHLRPVRILGSDGKAAGTLTEVQGIYVVALVRDGDVWRVDGVDLLQ